MTITPEHIYKKICVKCERPGLTFNRNNEAMCPKHAATLVRAEPVEDELPVSPRLSG
jgi:hypothetical protein